MGFKAILCYAKAIPFFFRTGLWCPHVYGEETKEQGIVITTNKSFRISNSLQHKENERVHTRATILRSRCTCCGKEDISWYDKEPTLVSEMV